MPLATVPVTSVLNTEAFEAVESSQIRDGYRRPGQVAATRTAVSFLFLTVVATLIDGYHPYSEDAGIYISGIKSLIHPELYGTSTAFITPYFRFSLFPRFNELLLRATHLPLDDLLFLMQLATTLLLLVGCWRLACRCFQIPEAKCGAAALVAFCLSVPVSGSSLSLMDPYLTGRSLSTPLTLLAIDACLERKPFHMVLYLAMAVMCHPLMSIYSIGFVLLLWASMHRSWTGVAGLIALALAAGSILQYSQRQIAESDAYRTAVETRSYYFLYRWQWYELIGLAAPLILFALYCRISRRFTDPQGEILARTCLIMGLLCVAISLIFARPSAQSHLIAALQTIRPFLIIYFCMFLLLGGLLGQFVLKRVYWRWGALFLLLGGGLALSQHRVYPASAQMELPWIPNLNSWNQAFLWIRASTPQDAIVALDADYIHARGEDAQGFRAIAERASLADQSKDGGAAAAFPELADRWLREQTATTNLNHISDAERLRRLTPFHVSWVVLNGESATAFSCPFRTATVKVCRLQ